MFVLGLVGSHNGSVALLKDGKIVCAIQLERLTRVKRDSFNLSAIDDRVMTAINYCLDWAGISLQEIDVLATNSPWPQITPAWIGETGSDSLIRRGFKKIITVPHHLSHAEYALHFSPVDECQVVVCDGSGTFESIRAMHTIKEKHDRPLLQIDKEGKESISVYSYDGSELTLRYRLALKATTKKLISTTTVHPLSQSLGHLWHWAALYCHGHPSHAGKVMGLAPYGDPNALSDTPCYFTPAGRAEFRLEELVEKYRTPTDLSFDSEESDHHKNVAAMVQRTTNSFLLGLFKWILSNVSDNRSICYTGGVALNSVANDILARELGLNLSLSASCEDNGTAIGCALAAHHYLTGERCREIPTDYLGKDYSESECVQVARAAGLKEISCDAGFSRQTAKLIAAGHIIAWFQGRSEFGPRALGNRSILADPRRQDMKDILNSRVKHREGFRPFAPAALEHRAQQFFDMEEPTPMMLRVVPVTSDKIPAVTHVDGSGRLQTVTQKQNPEFWQLISDFDEITGVPVILNTSFNVAGQPIVESPADAVSTFLKTDIDYLVLKNHVFGKPERT